MTFTRADRTPYCCVVFLAAAVLGIAGSNGCGTSGQGGFGSDGGSATGGSAGSSQADSAKAGGRDGRSTNCDDSDASAPCPRLDAADSVDASTGVRDSGHDASGPRPKADRLLGVEISLAKDSTIEASIINAFGKAAALGSDFGHASIQWSLAEPKEGTPPQFIDPNGLLDFVNGFYPTKGLQVLLTINSPINTTRRDMPAHLSEKALDDPDVIAHFQALLDFALPKIDEKNLTALVIGNEINIYLATHPLEAKSFKRFFAAVKQHAKSIRPKLAVGFTATLEGAIGSAKDVLLDLNQDGDFVSLTYYPLRSDYTVQPPEVVRDDFDAICALYSKPIYFQECGYPTSASLNSSEAMQSRFIDEVFKAWDANAAKIKLISFYELTDWPQEAVDEYLKYLGLASEKKLSEYVRTLGLRTNPNGGSDKSGYFTLKARAAERGWLSH